MKTVWSIRYADRTRMMKGSAVRELLKITQQYELAHGDFLEGHIQKIRMMYRERRDAMLSALSRHFPETARWTKPEGGLFLWVYLPSTLDAKELLSQAIQEKVAFVPGTPFYPERPEHDTLRLNFSNATPEKIEEGIRRLGLVIRRMLSSASQKQPIVREIQ